jgi:hypothetical protein
VDDESNNVVLTLLFSGHSVTVTHDGFTIGSSRRCDLNLNDPSLPGLHSVIHMQSGAIWIEVAADNLTLTVNDRPYRRMALRHEDRLKIGSTEFEFQLKSEPVSNVSGSALDEDLSLLTAEELCDRILSEQSMVDEFIEGQRSGWEALLRAIKSAHEEVSVDQMDNDASTDHVENHVAFEKLLEQIQELNDSVQEQSRELSDHEKEVLEATSMMEESQNRAVQQLDEIIERLKNTDPPAGLRASA